MNVGFMYFNGHWKLQCIYHNMFLSPFDFFIAVYSSVRINVVRSLHTSGVNNAHAGAFLFTD